MKFKKLKVNIIHKCNAIRQRKGSPSIVVRKETTRPVGRTRRRGLIPGQAKFFPLLQIFQKDSVAKLASYSLNSEDVSQKG
jgi:hypothetical protein